MLYATTAPYNYAILVADVVNIWRFGMLETSSERAHVVFVFLDLGYLTQYDVF